jgi:hypothetical protein
MPVVLRFARPVGPIIGMNLENPARETGRDLSEFAARGQFDGAAGETGAGAERFAPRL